MYGERRRLTASEVEQQYVAKMGAKLGKNFFWLINDYSILCMKWQGYLTLFGTRKERVDLLNKSARVFFGLLQHIMWNDILLSISRITDSPETCGKKNLTVHCLPGLVDGELQSVVTAALRSISENCKFAVDWRNRLIAHRDRLLAPKEPARPLAEANRQNVNDATESIAFLLNAVQKHYGLPEDMFDLIGAELDAENLLCMLRDGIYYDELQHKSLINGEVHLNDLKDLPPV
jgi:hypothetical protein